MLKDMERCMCRQLGVHDMQRHKILIIWRKLAEVFLIFCHVIFFGCVLKNGDSLCPQAVFILNWKGGRTSSALGMCVDTHNPDHVMAWSPLSPLLTFEVSNSHLIGQQKAHVPEMSLEIEVWRAFFRLDKCRMVMPQSFKSTDKNWNEQIYFIRLLVSGSLSEAFVAQPL